MSRSALALLPHIMRTASQVLTTDPKIVDYEANIFNDSFNAFFGVDNGCFVADGLAGFISLCWRNFNGLIFSSLRWLFCADAWRRRLRHF